MASDVIESPTPVDGVIRPFNATREGRRGSISEIPA